MPVGSGNIALALGHNSVVLYDPVVGCSLQDMLHIRNAPSPRLYSGTWKELTVVAALNVQLLVWYPAAALKAR